MTSKGVKRLSNLSAWGVGDSRQHLPFVGNIRSVTARVVATSPSNFELTVVLDKGTGAGIRKDMPVVAQEGLVTALVRVIDNANVRRLWSRRCLG